MVETVSNSVLIIQVETVGIEIRNVVSTWNCQDYDLELLRGLKNDGLIERAGYDTTE